MRTWGKRRNLAQRGECISTGVEGSGIALGASGLDTRGCRTGSAAGSGKGPASFLTKFEIIFSILCKLPISLNTHTCMFRKLDCREANERWEFRIISFVQYLAISDFQAVPVRDTEYRVPGP